MIGTPLADQNLRLRQRPDAFLEEEGIALRLADELLLQRPQAFVGAEEAQQ